MIVQIVLDVQYRLDVRDRRRVCLGLLHVGEVTFPGPGVCIEAIVLGFHKTGPSVIFDLGGPDKIKAVDSRGTAENLSTRPVNGAVSGIWLRESVVPPVVGGLQQGMCKRVAGNDWGKFDVYLVGICGGKVRR